MRTVKTRIQYEVPAERIEELEALMERVGLRTKSDLVEQALCFFELAVNERAKGAVIASFNEGSDNFKQLILPSIERVAPKK